jgi:hypothetical protein
MVSAKDILNSVTEVPAAKKDGVARIQDLLK